MAVLVVQVRIDVQNAIKEIEDIAIRANKDTSYENGYIDGLLEAVEIIKKNCGYDYEIGKSYYVVMPNDDISNEVIKMRLYKITQTTKTFYCFTTSQDYRRNTADLVLSNITSMRLRVFTDIESAEKVKNSMIWRSDIKNFK